MNAPTLHSANHHAAVVWVDHWHALVARSDEGRRTIREVDRDVDPEPAFLLRVARETHDCDRIAILGPGAARLEFEREYVSLFRRPDRLVDIDTASSATPAELIDRLRVLDDGGGQPAG